MRNGFFALVAFTSLWLASGCAGESNDKRNQRTIDPDSIVIDVEVGGVRTPDQVMLQYKKTGAGSKVLLAPNAAFLAEDFKVLENEFTVVYYDMRNRGRSQSLKSPEKLRDGVLNDVEDLETVRRHFQFPEVYLVGHGYLAGVAALYAQRYPRHTAGIIMVSPLPPDGELSSPEPDSVALAVQSALAAIERERDALGAAEYCRRWWSERKKLYVADPMAAKKIRVNICRYPNEEPGRVAAYRRDFLLPSLRAQDFSAEQLSDLTAPVLILHGRDDRLAPVAGAERWAERLPNAQLRLLEEAGHLPWVEQEGPFFGAVRDFLRSSE